MRSWLFDPLRMHLVRMIIVVLVVVPRIEVYAQWRFEGNTTPTWEDVVERYAEIDRTRSGTSFFEIGKDDDGSPIHLFVLSDGSGSTPDSIRASGKNILWITNGIHPGEPDGIDASLLLTQALLDSDQYMGLLANTAVCIVPVYNVSGARQRNSTSRVNQMGPEEYGFGGNARNLDLNRDFMKVDASNTRTLITALHHWDPDIYFETHVSNGADHQYVMELLTTHPDKLDPDLRQFMEVELMPRQYGWMEQHGHLMCPYFETHRAIPEQGLTGFVDGPRYSTGYNNLRQRIGILSESHMLKPYAERVNATFQLLLATLAAMNEHPRELQQARAKARASAMEVVHYQTNWRIDTTAVDSLRWSGYAADTTTSPITGLPRWRYHRDRPTDVEVPWMNTAVPGIQIERPVAYLIPRAWHELIERLQLDGVPMTPAATGHRYVVELQRITDHRTVDRPYEGHYLHHDIVTSTTVDTVMARSGDVLVPMGHATDPLVMELLEPRASDSFFAWGFFDAVLQQKEWFSDYVFEDIAARVVEDDPGLAAELEALRQRDPAFAKDAWAQLLFVYRHSPHMEPGYLRYPVRRVIQ
ncbi:MAG TPA: M14 family zinc carboxypeptidase [Flavobacteriales bacterium]|nr:M14 family zinc carboxypeptidase [Flavobacteriales bacterium]